MKHEVIEKFFEANIIFERKKTWLYKIIKEPWFVIFEEL